MVKCLMCAFEGNDPLVVLNHVVRKHKNNPTFRVQCQVEGCARTYQKWDSFRSHLRRQHADAVNQDLLLDETQEGGDAPVDPPQDLPQPPNLPHGEEIPVHLAPAELFFNGEPVTAEGLLMWKAGKFLTLLREEANTSQRAIDLVIKEVNDIMLSYLSRIHEKLKSAKETPEATSLSYENIDQVFKEMRSQGLFDGVSSKHLLDKFLDANGRVSTGKVYIGTEQFWSNSVPPRIVHREAFAYILPLEKSLRQLLSNPEILGYVLNPPVNVNDGVLRDVKDGAYYKRHSLFSVDGHALIIIFYYDDLQTSNALGSKPHKFSMFYWCLANIPPHLRSSLRAINLYGVARTKHLKQFGADKVVECFVSDIEKLQNEGIDIPVENGVRNFRGSMLFTTADTPAAQLLGGFKEGVGNAFSPCRDCDATQESMQDSFLESLFILRDKLSHNERVAILMDPTLPRQVAKNHSKTWGINGPSVFARLDDFDVTKCFVQDFMHVMLEGVLPLEIRHFLKYVVQEENLVELSTLNRLIKSFKYGHLQRDRPSEIEESHLENTLRQNSVQELALGHVLPFVLKNSIETHEEAVKRLNNLVLLIQICNLCLSFELREDDIAVLEHLIVKHHKWFRLLYPDVNVTPKMHYMVHFPRLLLEFGPLRYQWCIRFEGGHAYFKRLMSVVLSYKNPPWTMCTRFSSKRTVQLLTYPGHHASNFLDQGDSVGTGRVVPLEGHPLQDVLRNAFPALTINDSVMDAKFVIVKGTRYSRDSVILIRRDEDDFPQFGLVHSVFVAGQDKILLYRLLETMDFEGTLNAYKVLDGEADLRFISVRSLQFPHPLSVWRCCEENFIVLFNDVPEFFG